MASLNELIQAVKGFQEQTVPVGISLEDDPLMIMASDLDDEAKSDIILGIIAEMLTTIDSTIKDTIEKLEFSKETLEKEEIINEEGIKSIASLASELDSSEDETLKKQASVLDEVLNILGTQEFLQAKRAQEEQLNKLRDKFLKNQQEKTWESIPKEPRVVEAEKVVKQDLNSKRYRPLEAPGQTRSCPDHPGVLITRVADSVFQCMLDHKIYDYKEGYTLMNGNKIPGGSVARQTEFAQVDGQPQMVFDTREGRLQSDR